MGGLGGLNSVGGRSRGSAGLRIFAFGPYFSSRGWNRGSARVALRTLVLISKKRTLVLKLPNSNSKLARMCLLFLLSFHS
jgi:hypothetical protein